MTGVRPLSHSSMSMYAECPQKYKLKYVDGHREKPKYFFSFGNSLHKSLEYFYGAQMLVPPGLEDVLKYYQDHWLGAGYKIIQLVSKPHPAPGSGNHQGIFVALKLCPQRGPIKACRQAEWCR